MPNQPPPPDPLLDRLVAELANDTALLDEIRAAVRRGEQRERLTLAVLGVMAFARRAGYRAHLIRAFVVRAAREALAGREWDEAVRRRVARRCAGLVDAVYLLRGAAGFEGEPASMLGELRGVMGPPYPDASA